MKKGLKKLAAVLVLTVLAGTVLNGCASGSKGSKEVNVICWSEYLPQEVLDGFEKEQGIKVNMTTYSSPDEMLAKVQASAKGTYDLIIAPENYTPIFSGQNLLMELDRSKIGNFSNIDEKYLGRENDPDNNYSVPYMFASALIAVNTDVISAGNIKSYKDLLNTEYEDQMVVIEDSRAMLAMSAMATGHDVNDTSDEALSDIKGYMEQLVPNIHAYNGDSPKTLMINGECPIGLIYGAEIVLAQEENPSIVGIYPEEGVYMGVDAMMVTAEGKNTDNAYLLLNYILDGEVSASISRVFPYINPNKEAVKILGDEYAGNPLKNPPADVMARACTLQDIGDEVSKLVDLWTEIKTQ